MMKVRKLLRLVLLGFLAAILVPILPIQAAPMNPVILENMQAGTTQWQLGGIIADDLNNQIKGYASATSVGLGSTITFFVTVNPAQTFTMDFYRIGWYQGLGGRLMASSGPLVGTAQTPCTADATTGLIDCGWSASYNLSVPLTWTSGVYLVRLHNAAGYENFIDFVVRDGRPADLVYQQPVLTYQAYNNYPDNKLTGKGLYDYNSFGANTIALTPRAVKASFNRPYADNGVGDFFYWELDFVRWVEGSGYDVTYTTDIDTHENPTALRLYKGFVSPGHNEYWTKSMRDGVEAARDAGVNLAFFGANDDYWQVRLEPAANGVADRTVVCYKDTTIDPINGPTTTFLWRSAPVNRPEQTLLGVQFTSMVSWVNLNVPYVVTNSSHPVYANSGFAEGSSVPGLVGYEMDRSFADAPLPTGTGYTLLSHSPFVDSGGLSDFANSSIYQAPSGAWVFTAGTSSWDFGLDSYVGPGANAGIKQTTINLLNSFIGLLPPLGGLAPAISPTPMIAAPGTPQLGAVPTLGVPNPGVP